MSNIVNPSETKPEEQSERRMHISKVDMYLRLLRLIDQSADVLTKEPIRGTVVKESRRVDGEKLDLQTLWHHYRLTESTPDYEGGPEFMLRLPDCVLTVVYNPRGALPDEWAWTEPIGIEFLTESHIGAIMSAINTLVNTRTAS